MPSLDAGVLTGITGIIVGAAIGVAGILDNRRQRTKREKAVTAAFSAIERAYGTLIGVKGAIPESMRPVSPSLAPQIVTCFGIV